MASMFTIALLQIAPHGVDQALNLAKGEAFCRRARDMGADLALFPEMWNIGYTGFRPSTQGPLPLWRSPKDWDRDRPEAFATLERDRQEWQGRAIDRDSAFVSHFGRLARDLNMAIAITYLERWTGAPRNSVSLIDRHGQMVMTYAKVHTCEFDHLEAACTPGDDFYVASLDTAAGPVSIGAMICFDREFPESARVLMLKGAEIIITPNACGLELNRLAQFRTRAFENMVGVAMANYAAPRTNGHSVAFDPIAFDENGSRDTTIVAAGDGEGIYLAPFDLDRIRAYRESEVWGNAFRRPSRYGLLTSSDVLPPFVRVDPDGAARDSTS